jgi:hypothetical protein
MAMPDACEFSDERAKGTGTHSSAQGRIPSGPYFPPISLEETPGPSSWPPERVLIFEPQRRAVTPELKGAIEALSDFLQQCEAVLGLRRRHRSPSARAGFKLATEALACNVMVLLMTEADRPLAVPRHSGAMWGVSRYRSPVYGQHFLDVLELMAHPRVGLIWEFAPGFGYANGKSRRSLVRIGQRFRDHLPGRLAWSELRYEDNPEVLILRGPKDRATGLSGEIEYPESRFTRSIRKQVQNINGHLQNAPIIVLTDPLAETDDGQPIDPTRRTVRRIFNNGSWGQGGRLYGGFWETMRREDRQRLLRIGTSSCPEGQAVSNVDYGQLFTRLAYLEVGQQPPDGDLYDIKRDGQNRDGWKRLVNVLLLTDRPLRNWPEGVVNEFSPGTALREAVDAVYQRHAAIAPLFGCGAGLRLMRRESDVLIEVVRRLFACGITALPLHDSVLVAKSEATTAEAVMGAVFGEFTGGAAVSIKTSTH